MSMVIPIVVVSAGALGLLLGVALGRSKPRGPRVGPEKGRFNGGGRPLPIPADAPGRAMAGPTHEAGERATGLDSAPQHGVWEDRNYCWVVLCKNHWVHVRENFLYRHRIVIGETDAVSPPPPLAGPFPVTCDSCGREYLYKPSEVLRYETDIPDSFEPHPLFRW